MPHGSLQAVHGGHSGQLACTIPVPGSWTVEDCQAYSAIIGGQFVQRGCVFPTGDPRFSLGTGNGTIPNPGFRDRSC